MKLSGSQCHWHHLYILKWKERKDLPYYRRKSQMCLLSSAEWNELNILNAELHFDYCLKKESRKQPPIPTQAPLHFFFLYLLLKQMRPIVGNFCAALNASIVTLPEINAFNLPLWYIWDTIQQPVRSSKPCSKSVWGETLYCVYRTCGRELSRSSGNMREAPVFSDSLPIFQGGALRWERAEMRQRTARRTDLPSFRH